MLLSQSFTCGHSVNFYSADTKRPEGSHFRECPICDWIKRESKKLEAPCPATAEDAVVVFTTRDITVEIRIAADQRTKK